LTAAVSRASRRFYRSLFLTLAALGALVWVALDQFDVPRQEAAALLLGTLAVAASVILLAAVVTGAWIILRRWLRRRDAG